MGIFFLSDLQYCVTSLSGHCISLISLTFLGHPQKANELLHLIADGGYLRIMRTTVGSSRASTNHYHSMSKVYLLYFHHESLLYCIPRQPELSNVRIHMPSVKEPAI